MPTYDYICSNCGQTTEIVHSINGGPPSACPACGAVGTLRKAFNPPTIHFKGSGWAKKDRSGGHSRPARSSEGGSGNGSGGGEAGSESSGGSDGSSGDSPAAKTAAASGRSKADSASTAGGGAGKEPSTTSPTTSPAD